MLSTVTGAESFSGFRRWPPDGYIDQWAHSLMGRVGVFRRARGQCRWGGFCRCYGPDVRALVVLPLPLTSAAELIAVLRDGREDGVPAADPTVSLSVAVFNREFA